MRKQLSQPSFVNGFARSKSESVRPDLYGVIKHAYIPRLGIQGASLFDIAGRKNGTLTNMDPGTDWVVGQHGHQLSFDGSNDGVALGDGTNDGLTESLTYFAVVYKYSSGGSTYGRLFDKYPAPSIYFHATTTIKLYATIAGTSRDIAISTSASVPTNQWFSLCVVLKPSGQDVYFNGILNKANTTYAGAYSAGEGVSACIGNRVSDYARGAYMELSSLYILNREIGLSEITALHADPLLPLRRKKQWSMYVPSKPSGVVLPVFMNHYRNQRIA